MKQLSQKSQTTQRLFQHPTPEEQRPCTKRLIKVGDFMATLIVFICLFGLTLMVFDKQIQQIDQAEAQAVAEVVK